MSTILIPKSVAQIVTFWRPGSGDWSWADEYADLMDGEGKEVTERILARVDSEGIDFADSFAPVSLGTDGRIWDGHHRIVIAIQRGIHSLMCEVATTGELVPDQILTTNGELP